MSTVDSNIVAEYITLQTEVIRFPFWSSFVKYLGRIRDIYKCLKSVDSEYFSSCGWCGWNERYILSDIKEKKIYNKV